MAFSVSGGNEYDIRQTTFGVTMENNEYETWNTSDLLVEAAIEAAEDGELALPLDFLVNQASQGYIINDL